MGGEKEGKKVRETERQNDWQITRPDTRPIPVADGWAGAEMRVFTLFDSWSRTNGPTDGRTKPLIELRVRN